MRKWKECVNPGCCSLIYKNAGKCRFCLTEQVTQMEINWNREAL
jgi:hypothetical protein